MPPRDPILKYAKAVLADKVPACQWVKYACERHLRDLKDGPARGLYWSLDDALYTIEFFGLLKHSLGDFAGTPLILRPWQEFIVGSIFGWMRADSNTRRYRTAYTEIPKKNGKSTMAAGIGNLLFAADGEPGAEVYVAATKTDQARIVFEEMKRQVKSCPSLAKRVEVLTRNMHILGTGSKVEPLSRETKSMEGLNMHGGLLDELHAHPGREIYETLKGAVAARAQALIMEITTAGWNRKTNCFEHRRYSEQILSGVMEDDSWFAYIATIDDGDDWREEATWIKANPNYGVSVDPEFIRSECERAKQLPAAQNAFRRYHLNEWTEQADRWISRELWIQGVEPIDEEALKGRPCIGGLDLALVHDLSALALLFPPAEEGEKWKAIMRFWCPEEDILERSKKDGVPYDRWRDAGLLVATPGNATDFSFIEHELMELAEIYQIHEVAYDRMFAGALVNNLMDEGMTMVPYGQGFLSMAPACAEFERLLLAGLFQHGANPILDWNADNVAVAIDPAGNMKPDKNRATERIDGIVAILNALGRAIRHIPETSVYSERGLFTF